MRAFRISNLSFEFPELLYLLFSVVLLSFFYVFNDVFENWFGVVFNYVNILIVLGLCLLFHELVKKSVASSFGVKVAYSPFILGLLASLFTAIFTFGEIILFTFGINKFQLVHGSRLGNKSQFLREDERGKIVFSGTLASLSLALFIQVLSEFFGGSSWAIGVDINIWLALFNLIPIPKMNGSYVFVWNRFVWASSVVACISFGFLLPFLSIIHSLVIVGGLSVVLFFFLYSSKLL